MTDKKQYWSVTIQCISGVCRSEETLREDPDSIVCKDKERLLFRMHVGCSPVQNGDDLERDVQATFKHSRGKFQSRLHNWLSRQGLH